MYLSKNININSVEYNLKQVFKMFLSVLVNKYLNVFIFVMHFVPKPRLTGFCLELHSVICKQRVPLAVRLAEQVKYCSSEAI